MQRRSFSLKILTLACALGLAFGVCVSMAFGDSLEERIASTIEAIPQGTTTMMHYTYEANS